jgi:hypothetical protein
MPTFPIGFSISPRLIVKEVPRKTKLLAHIIPGNLDTYIFSTAEEYNQDYQNSFFAVTCKKAGWDCFRHYEILANGCIPLFIDIESIPEHTMTRFPKDIINETNKLYLLMKDERDTEEYKKHEETCYKYIERLLEHTRTFLTTTSMASYVLEKINSNIDAPRILFLSEQTNLDYLRCLTLQGFKELVGTNCHDFPKIEHIYTDYKGNISNLYGKGINYTKCVDSSLYDKSLDKHIIKHIKEHYYDLIIYDNIHIEQPLLEMVQHYYKPNEIVFFCGEDEHECMFKTQDLPIHVFIREL